ncbi:lytic transglycosylase [Sulfurifustis variabilis]|uniref:Lytic transglycosylase n=1 Tax=Sulfurifustis variabilis TaxID=1675686 RepID=A0A1B4V3E8_9GAMM|nr:lytic transglycosylase [Sulfurifustis variabilis]
MFGLTVTLIVSGCSTFSADSKKTAASQPELAPSVPVSPVLAVPRKDDAAPSAVVSSPNPLSDDASLVVPNDDAVASTETPDSTDAADNDLWSRIRNGFRIPKLESPLIAQHERWFTENAEFREAMFDRSKLYLYFIVEEVEKRGMPMEIALLPAIESAYKPYAYSRAKASGLWQFIPSTGKLYGLKMNWWYDGRRDVIAATRAALDYLQKLHDDFDGDWHLAIAAYNAGEGRVMRAIDWNRKRGLPTTYEHLRKLKPETKHYVPKLMAMVNLVSDPARYGVALPEIPNEPYFVKVDVGSQVDLGVIARLTDMEAQELHYINAGYMRWATDPDGPHRLLVPVDKKDVLLAGLSSLPEKERVQWRHHQVRRGDTLHGIARRYNISVSAIKTANKLRTSLLRVGQSLLLPVSSSAPAAGSARAAPVRAAARSGQPLIHRVRRGDTLYGIARRYNVLVQQIAEWNVLDPSDVLRLGQKLKIFPASRPSAHQQQIAPVYA